MADPDARVDRLHLEWFFSGFGGHGSYPWLVGRGFATHM
jgi:hypothetical protein